MNDQQSFRLEHQRDRREVTHRVVRQAGKETDVHRVRPERAHHQRIAIGRRLGHHVRADVAAGAGAILDQHRLAPVLTHPRADQASVEIGNASGGERYDDPDGLRRIRLPVRERAGEQQNGREAPPHASLLGLCSVRACGLVRISGFITSSSSCGVISFFASTRSLTRAPVASASRAISVERA